METEKRSGEERGMETEREKGGGWRIDLKNGTRASWEFGESEGGPFRSHQEVSPSAVGCFKGHD